MAAVEELTTAPTEQVSTVWITSAHWTPVASRFTWISTIGCSLCGCSVIHLSQYAAKDFGAPPHFSLALHTRSVPSPWPHYHTIVLHMLRAPQPLAIVTGASTPQSTPLLFYLRLSWKFEKSWNRNLGMNFGTHFWLRYHRFRRLCWTDLFRSICWDCPIKWSNVRCFHTAFGELSRSSFITKGITAFELVLF